MFVHEEEAGVAMSPRLSVEVVDGGCEDIESMPVSWVTFESIKNEIFQMLLNKSTQVDSSDFVVITP